MRFCRSASASLRSYASGLGASRMSSGGIWISMAPTSGMPGVTPGVTSVADLGCGRGRALLDLAAHFPSSRFVGYDLSDEAIQYATEHAATQGLTNVRFEVRDLSDFDVTAEPDLSP